MHNDASFLGMCSLQQGLKDITGKHIICVLKEAAMLMFKSLKCHIYIIMTSREGNYTKHVRNNGSVLPEFGSNELELLHDY